MASVFKKPGVKKGYWYAAYADDRGRRVQRTTKRTNRSEAMSVALAWESAARDGRAGILTETQARKVVDEIVERTTGRKINHYTARSWLSEWVEQKRSSVAVSTFDRYEQIIIDFLKSIGQRAELSIAAIGIQDVRSYRDSMLATHRSPATANMAIKVILAAAFNRARTFGLIQVNPCAMIDPLTQAEKCKREPFTAEQVKTLLQHADEEWRGLILCAYYTGMRLGDCSRLTWGDLDRTTWQLTVTPQKTKKRGASLVIPLHPEFIAWLQSRPTGIARAPIFPSLVNVKVCACNGLSDRFVKLMTKAGVSGTVVEGASRIQRSLSFHSLRHTFVSTLANAGVGPELRQKLSGHSSAKIHAGYTHHELNTLRTAVEKMPSIG